MKNIILFLLFLYGTEEVITYDFIRNLKTHSSSPIRINSGEPASQNLNSFVVSILDFKKQHICTGTILNIEWVITSAHCIAQNVRYIQYNTKYLSPHLGLIVKIDKALVHPNYKYRVVNVSNGIDVKALQNDIGLLKTQYKMTLLSRNQNFSHMNSKKTKLFKYLGKTGTVFGYYTSSDKLTPGYLTYHSVTLIRCNNSEWIHAICGKISEPEDKSNICIGDSGGPVFFEGSILGVSSLRPNSCDSSERDSPDIVFTSVNYNADGIGKQLHLSNTKSTKKCSIDSTTVFVLLSITVLLTLIAYFTCIVLIVKYSK